MEQKRLSARELQEMLLGVDPITSITWAIFTAIIIYLIVSIMIRYLQLGQRELTMPRLAVLIVVGIMLGQNLRPNGRGLLFVPLILLLCLFFHLLKRLVIDRKASH